MDKYITEGYVIVRYSNSEIEFVKEPKASLLIKENYGKTRKSNEEFYDIGLDCYISRDYFVVENYKFHHDEIYNIDFKRHFLSRKMYLIINLKDGTQIKCLKRSKDDAKFSRIWCCWYEFNSIRHIK